MRAGGTAWPSRRISAPTVRSRTPSPASPPPTPTRTSVTTPPSSRPSPAVASPRSPVSDAGQPHSEVEDDVALWLGTADERASRGCRLDRVGAVVEVAGDDCRLAGVADPGAARPSDGDVAGFCELEQAGVVAAPGNGQIAAREL